MSDRPDSNSIQQTAASHLQADGDINIGSITQIVNQGNATRGIPIDFCWREVCQSMLATTKALTSNLFTTRVGTTFELDDIYVPLGLVEKQPLQKRHEDVYPELGSQLYRETQEKITPIAHNQFFEQVLERGVSPKSRGRLIALTGEAGAGKTTLLQKIAHWVLENDLGLPIWVRLGQIRDSTLSEYLTGDWLSTAKANVTPEIKEDLEKQCRQGRVWLLLDGLDEMTNPTAARFIASLQSGWVTGVRMVLSCRLNVWEIAQNSLSGFDVYRNLDFEPEQVERFIRCWFVKTGEAQAGEQLLQALNNPGKERIKDLVKNPLRCSLLCRSWQLGEGELPDTKAELYAQFVDAIYDEWKDWTPEPFPTRSAAKRELNKALGRLAIRAIDEEKSRFVLRHDLVSSELGEPDEPLLKLALKLSWLNPVGVDPKKPLKNVYAFYHPTFEEYFAACAIDDWHFFFNHIPDNPSHPDARYRTFELQWKEVILLWLGREGIAKELKEDFIQALVEFDDGCEGFYWFQSYFLAAAGTAEFEDCIRAGEIVDQLFKWSLGDQVFFNPIARKAKVALQEANRTVVCKTLIKLLDPNQDTLVQHHAADYAGESGISNVALIKALTHLMKNTSYKDTRCIAARSLAKVNLSDPREAIDTLKELLYNNSDLSYMATSYLGEVGAIRSDIRPDIIEILTELVDFRRSEFEPFYQQDVLHIAASSLLKISPSNSVAIKALNDLMGNHWSDIIRNIIAQQLQENCINSLEVTANLANFRNPVHYDFLERLSNLNIGQFIPENLNLEVINDIIKKLIQLLRHNQDKKMCEYASWCLEVIFLGKPFGIKSNLYSEVITGLRGCPMGRIQENNHVIWHCAQTISYPAFYQAWHSQPSNLQS